MSETIKDIIDKLRNGDNVNAEKAFNTAMAGKMNDALDAKKVELASGMVQRKVEEPKEVPGTGMENDEEQELAPAEAEEE